MFVTRSCKTWNKRLPYATFFGFLVTGTGIILLFLTKDKFMQENISITKTVFDNRKSSSLRKADKILLLHSCCFIALSAMMFLIGFMSNGDYRAQIFRSKIARVFGVLFCGSLMLITGAVICWWLNHSEFYTQYYLYHRASEIECQLQQYRNSFGLKCMIMSIANILLDENEVQDFIVCDEREKIRYCEKYVPALKPIFLMFYVSFGLIISGQAIYCMCLAANCVKIHSPVKSQEVGDIRSAEHEVSSKDGT